jgi:hypothetical protein
VGRQRGRGHEGVGPGQTDEPLDLARIFRALGVRWDRAQGEQVFEEAMAKLARAERETPLPVLIFEDVPSFDDVTEVTSTELKPPRDPRFDRSA